MMKQIPLFPILRVSVVTIMTPDPSILVSQCAEKWEELKEGERETEFTKNIVSESEYLASNSELVGKNKLIYRIEGKYYEEVDAWRVILGYNLCGTNVISMVSSPRKTFLPKSSSDAPLKISTYRPSAESLKAMNLKDGENTIGYEYHVAEGVTDVIQVKLFVYPSKARIIISDIDGTITK